MKAKKILFLAIAICLASGVKAQFYDSADDIYYYVEYKDGEFVDDGQVLIFNFDGLKGVVLSFLDNHEISWVHNVKKNLSLSPDFYDNSIETLEYTLRYDKLSNTYKESISFTRNGNNYVERNYDFNFSNDRVMCIAECEEFNRIGGTEHSGKYTKKYKKVDKNYFKPGRSKTPSGTLHE